MNKRNLKAGAILSYLLIIVNTFYGLFFTPFLINVLGVGEYGVYKIIASLNASITVLDLGIGSTVLRYISKFNAKKDGKKVSNFSAMSFIQAAFLSVIILLVCLVMYFNIDSLYSQSFTSAELIRAKQLFILFIVLTILNVFEKVIFSIIAGCGCYAVANSLKLIRIVVKLLISWLILSYVSNSVCLLVIDIAMLLIIMITQLIYIRSKLGIKIKFYYWDNKIFKSSFKYTIMTFIQTLAVQLNGNIDTVVIGAYIGSASVAVYSIGLQLYNMYEQFAMAFSDLMLPQISLQIAGGASNKELEDTVIKVGRLEFMALGGALCGYIIIGKEFVRLWLGDGFLFAWLVGLVLMIPTTIPLVQNVCLSILRAKNKIGFRTIAVSLMAIFNLIATVIGVKFFGAIAACIGTVIGLVGANIIAMNIYYVKVIKINIFRIFKGVLSKTWLCLCISSIILIVIDNIIGSSWAMWLVKVTIFCVVYGCSLFIYGFNSNEKNMILSFKYIFKRRKQTCKLD